MKLELHEEDIKPRYLNYTHIRFIRWRHLRLRAKVMLLVAERATMWANHGVYNAMYPPFHLSALRRIWRKRSRLWRVFDFAA